MKNQNQKHTFWRLLKYIVKTGPVAFPLAIIGIIVSAFSTVYGSLFIQQLIDKYITPLLKQANPNFTPLFNALGFLALVYLIGVATTYLYTLFIDDGLSSKSAKEYQR